MLARRCLGGILLLGVGLLLSSCASPSLVAISLTPTTMYMGGIGAQGQVTAIGTYQQGNHPPEHRDITGEVTWKSSSLGVATVSSTGLVTSVNNQGSTIISASMNGFTGLISSNAFVVDCAQLDPSGTGCKTTTTP